MKKLIYALLLGGLLTGTSACRKYVEIPPEQTKILSTAADYQQLLYYSTQVDIAYYYPVYSGDDIGSDEIRWQNSLNTTQSNVVTWSEKYYGALEDDTDWSNIYKGIFIYNTVVNGVMSSSGTEQEKQAALSSALVHRAFAYFTLVNLYGKQYDATTASIDPGVPLVLQPKFTTDLTRASVQKVYDQVKADLTAALPGLPDLPDFNSNPSKASAYAILAKVFLNTREFTEAERYADLSLGLKNTLLDLNIYKSTNVPVVILPARVANPEELLIKRGNLFVNAFPISPDAESMYDKINDIRYTLFTAPGASVVATTFVVSRAYTRAKINNDGTFVGPSVPEVTLIKAECEARAGNTSTALDILNAFRKKRYNNAVPYVDLTAANSNAALHLVIDERKREFLGRGFRWFDQRRLSKDAGFVPTITREFKGVTYTLAPGSNRYVYPIADKYITQNPEITQNPR
ncbi:RagB/SusD family nutrient uptake outer membrane protein [Pedobacter sp. MC2016-14]|uniref:RagB/SusD family nutrient uptake outer membrane protein n=1 Tax=Pedobacter sp. MC2016-14 TaxID=2897327 RepID=UPI001E4A8E6E|nr:RagB/SusD family nutrient uptake outer membrane protein [Pedobacter sp. MC2016-14]MCD0488359.1 RagB/SusD family nutrient uptake outer membrane protein [Pedobacter sp. MC2016-14]